MQAQENSFSNQLFSLHQGLDGKTKPPSFTTSGLYAGVGKTYCVHCKKEGHSSSKCRSITNVTSRKDILHNDRRCFLCLQEGHNARECPSKYVCNKCKKGKHHISICNGKTPETMTAFSSENRFHNTSPLSSSSILMQTAKAHIFDVNSSNFCLSRILFDTGSQRSYVSVNVQKKLRLKVIRQERLVIKTFGDDFNSEVRNLDVVQVKVKHKESDDYTFIEALCVPKICSPLKTQFISEVSNCIEFNGLDFADSNINHQDLPVGVLIGIDSYFKFFKGKSILSKSGVTATESTLGWVLSGRICDKSMGETNSMQTFTMRCSVEDPPETVDTLRQDLHKFWNIEEVGSSQCVVNQFENDIYHDGSRYVSKLPFKADHDPLPDNYDVSEKRVKSLKGRLIKKGILEDYHNIFKDYEANGIIERVPETELGKENGQVHYLPHRPVVREDKDTTKIRSVFDASCKVNGPSLNDCLYSGPNLLLKIFDVLLRFRFNRIGILADIKQAFLNVGIDDEHKDFLRFLWYDFDASDNRLVVFRFLRAVFGVTSSPFLLNATIRHHMNRFVGSAVESVVEKILDDLYVDDLISGCDSVEEGKCFYERTKDIMSGAGFDLRKWTSNSPVLSKFISDRENIRIKKSSGVDDVSYFNAMSSAHNDKHAAVLGILWDTTTDEFVFNFSDLISKCCAMKQTKRGLLSAAASVFDTLGMISPITARIKTIFQLLCVDKLGWDDKIPDSVLEVWNRFVKELTVLKEIRIPRFIYSSFNNDSVVEIHGFSDSSKEVYCAVLYLRIISGDEVNLYFLASKTRVAPLKQLSIPRLELLGCVLLAKLLKDVLTGMKKRVDVRNVFCWSDSKVSLAWIKGKEKRWKPWVENRVVTIREIVDRDNWLYVKGEVNPADIPTRMSKDLNDCFENEWFSGPRFLRESFFEMNSSEFDFISPEAAGEAKKSFSVGNDVDVVKDDTETLTMTTTVTECDLSEILDFERFSSLRKLVNTIALIFRFIQNVKKKVSTGSHGTTTSDNVVSAMEYNKALNILIKHEQHQLKKHSTYPKMKNSLKLFEDSIGLLRVGGRFKNSRLTFQEQCPKILRDSENSYVTKLIIWDSHRSVLHHGIESTLARIRSQFWIVRGRKAVKTELCKCVTCKRYQGKTMLPPASPDLPDFRVRNDMNAFNATGLDYAGPLFVKDFNCKDGKKVYILLLTCASSRAIHLELVPDMKIPAFIRAFTRFISRRGVPSLVVHDNFKTFRSVEVKSFLSKLGITQQFILAASPWWGGFYERLVRSVKTTLKKTLGKSFLSFEELQTILCETESVINSRPLCYVGEDDISDVLTPHHLIFGRDISQPSINSTNLQTSYTVGETRKRNQYVKNLLEHFWKRFSTDYLNELRQSHFNRHRKTAINPILRHGDVVIIREDTPTPRTQWRMAKVLETVIGADGKQRGAKLLTLSASGKNSIIHRPFQKIVPFEISDEQNERTVEPEPEPEPESKHVTNPNLTYKHETRLKHDTHIGTRSHRKTAIEGQYLRRLRQKYQ